MTAIDVTEFHRDRGRAEGFGSVAEDYERFRPEFPAALVDELVALAPRCVLDVATGTGKLARAIAARGPKVVGVEIDERMASVARRHGVEVEVAKFEEWNERDRTFDLVVCGDAWHWIDAARGEAIVARVVERGKTFARIVNHQVVAPEILRALEPVYRDHGNGAQPYGAPLDGTWTDPLRDNPLFHSHEMRTYTWERIVSAADWVAFLGTISDHVKLGDQLAPLLDAARAALAPFDPTRVHGTTYAMFAKRS